MFDVSKIKKFDLTDLSGKTLKVESLHDKEVNIIITMAFDVKTGDTFVLDYKSLPIAL